jgi:hypothetical protein
MSLIQLPKVIELVNTLSEKVHKLETEVKALQEYNLQLNRQMQTKPKKND